VGEILCSRRYSDPAKVIVEVLLDQQEFRQLRGEMDDVYLFSDKAACVPSKVSLRGRNEATKYFLIPRQLRKQIMIHGGVSCQRFEHDGKSIFVYVLDPYKRGTRL
jgi:hypothetical protein